MSFRTLVLLMFTSLWANEERSLQIGVEIGSNFFGNTLGISLDIPFASKVCLDFQYSAGTLDYKIGSPQGATTLTDNSIGSGNQVHVDLLSRMHLGAAFVRSNSRETKWFPQFALGFSQVHIRYQDRYFIEKESTWYWADEHYALQGIYAQAKIAQWNWTTNRCYFAIQTDLLIHPHRSLWAQYKSDNGRVQFNNMYSKDGPILLLPYPELSIGVEF